MNFLRNCRDGILKTDRQETSSADSVATDRMDDASYVRRAHHAGSWYSSDAGELDGLLGRFLADAEGDGEAATAAAGRVPGSVPNACVSPHAGFRYSGPTAAYSYLALKEALRKNSSLRTIVVLHPSHHVYLDCCAVSGARIIETPLGNMRVDNQLREQLLSTDKFGVMEQDVDEEEHSGEMQYPYIAKIINDYKRESGKACHVKILPIMVGSIKPNKEESFGRLLSPYLSDRGIFTAISSDFCHYFDKSTTGGRRFNYMPQPSPSEAGINEVYEYIEFLDKKGMDLIELQRPGAFVDYLREYSNTICGRHPISVWLNSVRESALSHEVKFVKYAQSEKARSTRDHSALEAKSEPRCIFIHDTNVVAVDDNIAHNPRGPASPSKPGTSATTAPLTTSSRVRAERLAELHDEAHHGEAMDEWAWNVAAGSESQGFWLEIQLDGLKEH
ncbi:hypothetical protein ACHAWF_015194 [Thalassiosira exigua]